MVASLRRGRVRVSPHLYNTHDEMRQVARGGSLCCCRDHGSPSESVPPPRPHAQAVQSKKVRPDDDRNLPTPRSSPPSRRSAVALVSRTPSAHRRAREPARCPAVEDRTASMQLMDGFLPIYWDEAEGKIWLEIGLWDTDVLHADRSRGRAGVERHRHRPGAADGIARGAFSSRRTEGADDSAQLPLPREQRQSRGTHGGGGRLRAFDAMGLSGRTRRPETGCWWTSRPS